VKKLGKRNFSFEISKENSEVRKSGCAHVTKRASERYKSEKPSRSLNDVDLIGSGLAQLVIVARLCAWRGVRAEASRFGVFRRRCHFPLGIVLASVG
jgi:hypothetical protein